MELWILATDRELELYIFLTYIEAVLSFTPYLFSAYAFNLSIIAYAHLFYLSVLFAAT